jgi:hypothetical protein
MLPQIAEMISKYGFPIVAAGGLGFMIYTVWKWVTMEVKPVLSEANTVLIGLIDRIRMMDNDLIRLREKLTMVQEIKQPHMADQVAANLAKVDRTPAKVSQPLDGKARPDANSKPDASATP